jgi:hypothetical protein
MTVNEEIVRQLCERQAGIRCTERAFVPRTRNMSAKSPKSLHTQLETSPDMASKDPKSPGLGIDSSPAHRAALLRLLGSLVVAVKVDPKITPATQR